MKPSRLPGLPYGIERYPTPARRRARRFFSNLVAALRRLGARNP